MRCCYTDFAFPILDYLSTLNGKEIVYEWLGPAVAGIGSYFFFEKWASSQLYQPFLSTLISLFAILVGFTIAAIAIFTTADTTKNKVLQKISDREINDQRITWFRYVYLNLIYSVVAGVGVLGLAFLSIFISSIWPQSASVMFPLLEFGTFHNLLLAIRNTTNLYLVFFGAHSGIDPSSQCSEEK